jgi:hypothetical protein
MSQGAPKGSVVRGTGRRVGIQPTAEFRHQITVVHNNFDIDQAAAPATGSYNSVA